MVVHMKTREQILADIEAYIARTGMSARTFGIKAVSDSAFVYRMRAAKAKANYTWSTLEKIERFMADNPPSKKKRPDETRTAA